MISLMVAGLVLGVFGCAGETTLMTSMPTVTTPTQPTLQPVTLKMATVVAPPESSI